MSLSNLALLKRRAELKSCLRNYLAQENILEIDVPVLGKNACPDSAVHPISFKLHTTSCFLQPSPEMFLKRVLAQHPIDCYSLGPVFRDDPITPLHNPEFLMLEFYLVGEQRFQEIINKTLTIAALFVGDRPVEQFTYEAVWSKILGQPYQHDKEYFIQLLKEHHIDHDPSWEVATLEDLAFGSLCQPHLGQGVFTVIAGFPKAQAALANCDEHGLAGRFEFFIDGFELANGYDELIDPVQNRIRFERWHQQRASEGLPNWSLDEKFLSAIEQVPACSGVAIGLERLFMLALQQPALNKSMVLAWDDL